MATYYERYWTTGFSPPGGMFDELARLLDEHAAPGSSWADIGCGTGATSGPYLTGIGCRYIGCDISPAVVSVARNSGFDAEVIDDASSLPFDDSSMDGVLFVEVLEHLFEPQLAASEAARVLRPGGVLIATVPNVAYWRRRLELAVLGRFDPIGDDLSISEPWRDPHIRFFTAQTLQTMLQRVGFNDVRVRAHAGQFLGGIPKVGRRISRGRTSRAYRTLERHWPLLGERLHAVAHC